MNKYVAMMREQEYVGYRLAEYGQGSSTRAHGDKCATDWRAIREAWEAMVEACGNAVLCWGSMDYDESPFRRETIAALRDALTKARVE